METEPCVEARPPALIESAVGLIVPPAAREHVLGDLFERYASPGLYVLEAARTLPFVLASQSRRTSHFVAWPMIALMLATWGNRAEPARGAAHHRQIANGKSKSASVCVSSVADACM